MVKSCEFMTKVNKLRQTHINQLLNYCIDNEREGSYYGNKEQYEKRHQEIKEWLESFRC